MRLVTINRNQDVWPFHSLENTDSIPDCKWTLIANNQEATVSMGILHGIDEDNVTADNVTDLTGFLNIITREQITKADVVRFAYTQDQEYKLLRDAASGRNTEAFNVYDAFIESIPGDAE